MLTIKQKLFAQTFILSAFFLLLPSFASADTSIYSQTVHTSNTGYQTVNNSGPYYVQGLGTGLTGVVNSVDVYLDFGKVPVADMYLNIVQCDSSNYITCSGSATLFRSAFTVTASSTGTYTFIGDNVFSQTFDSSKYYWIQIYENTAENLTMRFYGSSSDLYSGGSCQKYNGGTLTACTTIADMFFSVNGAQTVSDYSYTVANGPLTGSTTVSTFVTFNFNYHAVASNNISSYGLVVFDNTTNTNFTLTGTASTGDTNVKRTVSLSSGHKYTWSVQVCGSACYGGSPNSFYVVSTSSVPIVSGVGGTPTTTTSVASSTGGVNSFDINNSLPSGLNGLLKTKFPFSYVYDGFILLGELSNGTSQSNAGFTFPLGASLSNGSTTFTVVDQSAVTATGYVTGIRTAVSMVIYFTTAVYLLGGIMSAI